MIARLRAQAPWWAVGLALLLPALGGGYSTLLGWPQASLIFTAILALMLTEPAAVRRLPWWYWTLGGGLAVLGVVWLWPGEGLVFLSPQRRAWPGPSGAISGIAADRVGTWEGLFQALGFFAVLGIALLALDRPDRRRLLLRWMLVGIGLTVATALLIHFFRPPIIVLPDVPVLYWTRLSYPFTGANLAAAYFISSVPLGAGLCLVFSAEEKYLPVKRVWQLVGVVTILMLLALQMLTQNRWMWLSLMPFLAGGSSWYLLRKRSRQRRLRALFIVLLLTLGIGFFLTLFDPGAVIQRFVLLIETDQGSSSRSLVWQNSWNTFCEYPWVGVGLGGFGEVCPTTAPAGIYLWPRYAHSEPLQWLSEAGIVGGLLLGTVLLGMGRTVWRQIHNREPWLERLPFALAALLMFAACLVDFPLRCPALLFLFALYLGAVLGRDRTAAEIATAGPAGAAGAAAESTAAPAADSAGAAVGGRRWRWVAALPAVALVAVGIGFYPRAVRLFERGQALANLERRKRSYPQDRDAVAMASAAQTLFQAADRQPRWSGEALNTMLATLADETELSGWAPAVAAVLEDSPYHDSLYYFLARVALQEGDLAQAAKLNSQARVCAATNRRTLRKIAVLDWVIAGMTTDAGLRRERLEHAQATTRWLLAGNPDWLVTIATVCGQLNLPLDDLLPGIPALWRQPGVLCQVALKHDRPLTVQALLAESDLYARAVRPNSMTQAPPVGLTRWDLAVLTATGQTQAIDSLMLRLYRETPPDRRGEVVAEVRRQGWGLLTPEQLRQFCAQVEKSLPGAMEQYQLGLLYLQMGESGLARQSWLRSYKSERTAPVAAALMRLYYNNAAWAGALNYALEWTQLDADNPVAWRSLASAGVASKDWLTAKRAFERYQALAPAQAEADFVLHGTILRGGIGPAGAAKPARP